MSKQYKIRVRGSSSPIMSFGETPVEAFEHVMVGYTVQSVTADRAHTKADVCIELVGGSRQSVNYYRMIKKAESKNPKRTNNAIKGFKLKAGDRGEFDVVASADYASIGVDIEFTPTDKKKQKGTLPRVLFECPKDGKLRILIWDDPNDKNYSKRIEFDV